MLKLVVLIIGWYFMVTFRLVKLMLAWILGLLIPATETENFSSRVPTTDEIAKEDMIAALDGQIAVLEQERQLYWEKAIQTADPEKRISYHKKVAQIEVQISMKTAKVLKLREEIEQ